MKDFKASKKSIFGIAILFIVFATIWLLLSWQKTSNISNNSIFDFNDYKEIKEMYEAIKLNFPEGTPKRKIDSVLVIENGAEITNMGNEEYRYLYNPIGTNFLLSVDSRCQGWRIFIQYDNRNLLENFKVNGPCI